MTSEVRNPSKVEMSMHSSGVASDIRNSSSSAISPSESGAVKEIIDPDPLNPNKLSASSSCCKTSAPSLSTGCGTARIIGKHSTEQRGGKSPSRPPCSESSQVDSFTSAICRPGGVNIQPALTSIRSLGLATVVGRVEVEPVFSPPQSRLMIPIDLSLQCWLATVSFALWCFHGQEPTRRGLN